MTDSPRLQEIPWSALNGLSEALEPALAAVLGGEAAERVLDKFLRAHRSLSSTQRTVAAEALFGVGLWRRRLAYHLGSSDWTQLQPRRALFSLLRDLAGLPLETAAALARVDAGSIPAALPAPTALADRWSLPDWLATLLVRELGADAEACARALNSPGPICVRANTLRTTRDRLALDLAAEGVESIPAPHAPHALLLEGRPNIFGLTTYREGLFEVQDEGSQLLGMLVGARPGETVLDFCAGAGGKSLLLAAEMKDEGALYAYDSAREPLERLRRRAERAGASVIRVLTEAVPSPLLADRVLVDAPCSALGALRRGPDVRFRLNPSAFESFPPVQREILTAAAAHVRPGGTLAYATCTFRREENEEVAHGFEQAHPDFALVTPSWVEPSFRRNGFFACLPHLHQTDGFFAAVFERRT